MSVPQTYFKGGFKRNAGGPSLLAQAASKEAAEDIAAQVR